MKRIMFLFDWDGTLIQNALFKINEILKKIDLPEADPEVIRVNWGKPFYELILIILTSIGAPDALEAFMKEKKKYKLNFQINVDIMMTLWKLKNMGHCLSLVTNRTRESLFYLFHVIGFDYSVFHIVETSDCGYKKPDGRIFLRSIDFAKANQCTSLVYFGDTVDYDWRAVQDFNDNLAAGIIMDFVGVISDTSNANEFEKSGAHNFIHGIHNLPQKLNEIAGTAPDYPKHNVLQYASVI